MSEDEVKVVPLVAGQILSNREPRNRKCNLVVKRGLFATHKVQTNKQTFRLVCVCVCFKVTSVQKFVGL